MFLQKKAQTNLNTIILVRYKNSVTTDYYQDPSQAEKEWWTK